MCPSADDGAAVAAGMVCGCLAVIRGGALHVTPCRPEHAEWVATSLPGQLTELGLTLPVVIDRD
jgi:hypothetical protein